MKSQTEVRKKLKDVKYSYLTKELKRSLKVCPQNCVYNYRHVELNDEGEEVEIGLCTYGADGDWNGNICDDEETALACPVKKLLHTKEDVKRNFEKSLEDEVIVAHQYKDIAALQWVIGDKVYAWDLTFIQKLILWVNFFFLSRKWNRGTTNAFLESDVSDGNSSP